MRGYLSCGCMEGRARLMPEVMLADIGRELHAVLMSSLDAVRSGICCGRVDCSVDWRR